MTIPGPKHFDKSNWKKFLPSNGRVKIWTIVFSLLIAFGGIARFGIPWFQDYGAMGQQVVASTSKINELKREQNNLKGDAERMKIQQAVTEKAVQAIEKSVADLKQVFKEQKEELQDEIKEGTKEIKDILQKYFRPAPPLIPNTIPE